MGWEVVNIPINSKGRTSPYASIGFDRLALSVAACELIENYEKYKYVQLLKNTVNGRLLYVGVQFLEDSASNAIKISRKKSNGKLVGGIEISNSKVLRNLFGSCASAKSTKRYEVKKDDTYSNLLVIVL